MSLTKEQWVEMWESVTSIENEIKLLKKGSKPIFLVIRNIELDIDDIKKLIQSVIGQME